MPNYRMLSAEADLRDLRIITIADIGYQLFDHRRRLMAQCVPRAGHVGSTVAYRTININPIHVVYMFWFFYRFSFVSPRTSSLASSRLL